MHVGIEGYERIRQVRAHEPVGASDEHGTAVIDLREVAAELVESAVCPGTVGRHEAYAVASMGQRTPFSGLGSLGSGAVTAVALAVQTGLAAVVGVVLGREFGRGPETDGFFAAYGVFVVAVLAANAIRVTVLPAFARARTAERLGGEVASFALALATLAVPLLVVGPLAAEPIGGLLTGGDTGLARATAADALPWMLLAATLQLYAGLAASALAALDDYVTAAAGFALGSLVGLVYILDRVDADGVIALSHGMALNGLIAVCVPAVALALRAQSAAMPGTAVRPAGEPYLQRLGTVGSGVALPIALQVIYLACVPLAAREGEGALTSFGFAYLISSAVVAVTASSLGLVTAVPLTRAGLDAARTARHVVSSSWIALVVIGAAAGVFALAGGRIAQGLLGSSYSDDVGNELGRLVVVLSLWAVVSVGVSLTFPLVFVGGHGRALPLIAVGAVALQVVVAIAGQRLLGLDGLALALAVTTVAVLGALLTVLGALSRVARGLAIAALTVAAGVAVAFAPPALLLPSVAAAVVGLVIYTGLVVVARPAGLREAWQYLRTLA